MRRCCLILSLLFLFLGARASSPHGRVGPGEGPDEGERSAAAPLLLPGTYPLRRVLSEEGGVPEFEPALLATAASLAGGGAVNSPPFISRQPLFARMPLGESGPGVLLALDEASGTGAGYDRLYFDARLDGNLTALPPVQGEMKQSGAFQTVSFDCPAMPACYGGEGKDVEPPAVRPVRTLVRGYRLGDAPWRFTYVLGEHRAGNIASPQGPVQVVLADSAMRAAFDRPCAYRSAIPTGDGAGPQLWLTPDPARPTAEGSLQLSLGEAQLIGRRLYRFEPSADGLSLTVRPYPHAAATARIAAANARREELPVTELTLQGSAGRYELDQETLEQPLPPGEYYTLSSVRQADREGDWVFRFRSNASLRLPPARATELPIGGALRAVVGGGKPALTARRGEEIKIPLAFVTAAGHELIGLQRADGRDGSARVVIRSPLGKVIARSGSGFA